MNTLNTMRDNTVGAVGTAETMDTVNTAETMDMADTVSDISSPGTSASRGHKEFLAFWHTVFGDARVFMKDERGMSTIEYALGCVAAAALGAVLYTLVNSDAVYSALEGVIQRALNQAG